MAATVKKDNFCTIQGWMRTILNLKGNELIAYALIYGFSQCDGQYMVCSQDYISSWLGINRTSTNQLLKRLVNKGLIEKVSTHTCCKYRAIIPGCMETEQGCMETEQGCMETEHNIYNNNYNNNYIDNHNHIQTTAVDAKKESGNDRDNSDTSTVVNANIITAEEERIKKMIAYDAVDDEADLALVDNLIDVLLDKVFLLNNDSIINIGSRNNPDNKRVLIVKWMLEKNLNYSIVMSYLGQIKSYGKPIKNPQYILKTIYNLCLGGKTINQSHAGYIRY